MVWIIEIPDINESFQSFVILSLFLRISEIYCLLTPYSVDNLVPISNHKIIDCLSFMKRMDRLCFVDIMISFDAETSSCSSNHAD